MKIGIDKLKHLIGGCLTVLSAVAVVVVARDFGIGPAVALATTLMGIGYELQQRLRKEGEPSWKDALATALPGYAAWAVIALTKAAQTGQSLLG